MVSAQARPWEPTVEWPSARQASCPSKGSCAKVNLNDDQTHAICGSPPTGLARKTREVDVLHRISESISNQLDLEAILKHIVEVVVEVTKADACLLYLLSDSQDELILRASKNPHPKLIGRITIGLGEGITGWVAQERTRVVIPSNANDDPRFKFFHNLPEDRHQAFVSVPIMAKKKWLA